ncbi:lactonase family protein [Psychromicrobium lacuslunae]|uniref:lactonase family protein n=1 Tax=Psychromicrobium lacuslunae TaxID=1618207 RepID=UPI0005D33F1A|nr:beta-propeller fold lactonase family protein [Psychromicrobium lacuslunae]
MELLVGSYTSAQNHGAGISAVPIKADGLLGEPRTLAEISDPSFLALADDGVFAVQEQQQGKVAVFERDPSNGALELVSESEVIGVDPCHLTLLTDGRVVAANYGSGSVVLLSATNRLELQDLVQFDGSGPVTERQVGPHAHQVVPTPYGTLLVSDLGSDTVTEFRLVDQRLEAQATLRLPAGAGPRHLVFRRGETTDWLLVLGELDGGFHLFARPRREASGDWNYTGSVPLASRESVGTSYPAHIELSADQRLAYVSVRGQDQISVFDLTPLGRDEMPLLLQEQPTEGVWPRHFALGNGVLYAANQFSDNIVVFALGSDGLLAEKLQEVTIGTPVCLVLG